MNNLTGKIRIIFTVVLIALFLISGKVPESEGRVVRRVYPEQPRYAFTPKPYFTGRAGIFIPNDETDGLDGFSSGFYGGIGLGYRSSPYLAFEGELNYYESEFDFIELRVVPLLFNVRFIYPGPFVEPYLQMGAGIYFAEFDFDIDTDSGAGLGIHFGTGLDFKVSPGFILGIEFRWFFVEPDFADVIPEDPNVGGAAVNFLLRTVF